MNANIFQLSNQVTLGISEKAAIQNLSSIALQIISQEKQARALLVKDEDFMDKIFRAYGILKSAYKLTAKELAGLLSFVRVGASEGLIEIPLEELNRLFVELQPATMNAESDAPLSQQQRDLLRAQRVREALG